ncbi:sugar diacid recognition domain-containing protein [Cellulosilyticum sp. I15G10I2]|uniref:sugar diacid recognition domain-containing protein n=1 Tax=Cellulosilyticum sp. I15G10I2 TaxID=1892843 RepID=UPI00085C8EA3|nr:sugar diacid recognition domain-containing protein [Cellulosilyticum sp. I15G10I2]
MQNRIEFPIEFAEKIVQMFHKVTGEHIDFMNQDGIIVATTQPERLKKVHEGAQKIMSGEVDELAIEVEDAKRLNGVMPGYNGVVLFKGERIACIGVSGDPKTMRPFQRLAAVIARKQYAHFLSQKVKQDISENK